MHDLNARVRPKVLFFDQSEKEHLKGQRLRVWWARNAETLVAAVVCFAFSWVVLSFPPSDALRYISGAVACVFLAVFIVACTDIRREQKERRK